MDSSTGISYLQNQIRKKTVSLCNVSIRRNLCLKLQKVDEGDIWHTLYDAE